MPKKYYNKNEPLPKKYKTNTGKIFDIQVLKSNICSLKIRLLGPDGKVIKVKKRSQKLVF